MKWFEPLESWNGKKFPLQTDRSQLEFKTTDWTLSFQVSIPSLLKKQWNIEYREEHYSAARRYEFYFFEWWKQYFKNERSEWVNIAFPYEKIKFISAIQRVIFFLLRRWGRRFLIESLVTLCVRGWPVHVPSTRNREKRLSVGSKSAPSWNVTIASSMPSVPCAILKRHNSMFAL